MRQASVGFQCPECVSQGARDTRAGRTTYGGSRSSNPALTSMVIIAINVAVWLLVVVTGWQNSPWVARLSLHARGLCQTPDGKNWYPRVVEESTCSALGGDWFPGVSDGAYHQLLTSTFLHVDVWHIGFNMLALWFLGPQLEMAIGRARFLALYLISGLAGSACVYWLAGEQTSTLGASGAVYGLMAALLVIAIKVGGQVQTILMWIGLNVVLTIVGGFSWQGHLGGFVGGAAVMTLLVYSPRTHRATYQVAGIAAVALLVGAAVVTRSLALA
ncbi:rhomboid family intramembrane serine protease [Nocardioides guangzhouensis]|nr:rhomboid family intramembrane serine protease [Nocardioides guangzhouensis]